MELLDRCINVPYTKGEKMHLAMMDFISGKMTYEELCRKFENI